MISVLVNAEERRIQEGTTLESLLTDLGKAHSGIAVAMDGEVVSRADWPSKKLGEGTQVEILTAVQGG